MSEFGKYLKIVSESGTLSYADSERSMQMIMNGGATPAQAAAMITALKIRGETTDEIAGFANTMRFRAKNLDADAEAIDMCGTGGDGLNTLNVSTAAMFVTHACGVKIAKHGNRAASSKSGSSDVLTSLGVQINLEPEQIQECYNTLGICYMPAPVFHRGLANIHQVRQELGFRTIFNILGPLCNPARIKRQLLGVCSSDIGQKMIAVLQMLGHERAWVVSGNDGMDEISISTTSVVYELQNNSIQSFEINPEDYGLTIHPVEELKGGDSNYNAKRLRAALSGEEGAYRNSIIINAAAALIVADKAPDLAQGIKMASSAIDSGAALNSLNKMVDLTASFDNPRC